MVIWVEYLRQHTKTNWRKTILLAWLAPLLMSGLLELLQANCTQNRNGEWLDFIANSIGCTLALAIGTLLAKCLGK
jgi:VanZ family protein